MKSLRARMIFCLLAVFVPFVLVLVTDTSPKLGLDLQGGISVALSPVRGDVSDGQLDKAKQIVENRVNGLGVAESEVGRLGDGLIVELPGIDNRQRALAIIGATAELRFRPVLNVLPPEGEALPTTTSTTSAPEPGATTTTGAGATTSTTRAGPTSTTKQEGRIAGAAEPATTTTATTAPASTATTTAPLTENPETSEVDDPNATVVLPMRLTEEQEENGEKPIRLQLGPAELKGDAVTGADANFDQGEWGVTVEFNSEGQKGFTDLTRKYVGRQLAIVLDGVVQSYPTINQIIEGDAYISGAFTKGEAEDLADTLRYGALPVALEPDNVQSISPTLGRDQLRVGIITGLIGLALVLIYMVFYYRALGFVIWAGLGVSAVALYTLVCALGAAQDLTLTLAGVTGIIVSVGYTVDSYVVYFERLKDEVRSGKTIRSSLDRGFARSFKTILTGNFVSILGAGLLYFLAVGSVRGFAYFLGLTTLLDTFVAYFFMHPLTSMVAGNAKLEAGGRLGVGRGLGIREATA